MDKPKDKSPTVDELRGRGNRFFNLLYEAHKDGDLERVKQLRELMKAIKKELKELGVEPNGKF